MSKTVSIRVSSYRPAAGKSKFGAKAVVVDATRFDSKKEANYYVYLKALRQAGEIAYFLRQVPFDLPGNTKYRVDFMLVYPDGRVRYIDVKGFQTKDFIRAKKQVEALYPIEIELA